MATGTENGFALSKVTGLRKHLEDLVDSHALTKPKQKLEVTLSQILKDVAKQFAATLKEAEIVLDRASLVEFLKDIAWTSARESSLKDWLNYTSDSDFETDVQKWQSHNPQVPLEWVKEKTRWLVGVSKINKPVAMLPGMGRLGDPYSLRRLEEHIFVRNGHENPFRIPVAEGRKPEVFHINGANLGLPYNRVIEENPLRCKLAEAEVAGATAVVLTNLFDIAIYKSAGALPMYRAHMSGHITKIESLDPDYQQTVREIMKKRQKGEGNDELVYIAPNEMFVTTLSGLHKIAIRPNKKEPEKSGPEFSGPIYVILGYRDDELIKTTASWALRYFTIVQHNRYGAELRLIERALAELKKKGATRKDIRKKEREHRKVLVHYNRTINSNIAPEERRRYERVIRAFFIKSLEETVPNLKVINQGSTVVELGGTIIEFNIPDNVRVSDEHLSKFVNGCGNKILRRHMSPLTVICPPYSLNYRSTVREADFKGQRYSVDVVCAPTLVDDLFLREEVRLEIRKVHPAHKAIFREQFVPGSLRIRVMPDAALGNIIAVDELPITRETTTSRKANLYKARDVTKSKYIWVSTATDQHWGSRAKCWIWCDETRTALGMFEAMAYLMRRDGLLKNGAFPVHMFNSNDDVIQGNHYNTERQPDPNQMTYAQIEDYAREMWVRAQEARSKNEFLRYFDEYQRFTLFQLRVRGIDWVHDQIMEVYDRHVTPNVDFFDAVVHRAVESKLIIRGVGDWKGMPYDRRDIGAINEGTGNHIERTLDRHMPEGALFAHKIQDKLLAVPRWQGKDALIKRLVKAPMEGNIFIGWGTIQAPGGYEWGIDLRSSPASMGSWGDTLLGVVRNDERRGNVSGIFEEKVRLVTFGDKHFHGDVSTPVALYHMCASGTHTDTYGHRGFPPNNTGVSFVGLPADGPGNPVLRRTLRFDQLQQLVNGKGPFDWESFLPNPV